jgi:hypothetical protein
MFGAGVDPLGEVLAAVRSLVAGFEVDGLAAPEAARVVEQCAEATVSVCPCNWLMVDKITRPRPTGASQRFSIDLYPPIEPGGAATPETTRKRAEEPWEKT